MPISPERLKAIEEHEQRLRRAGIAEGEGRVESSRDFDEDDGDDGHANARHRPQSLPDPAEVYARFNAKRG